MLPGVFYYASAFFCTKMAVFQLLMWLPTFLKQSELAFNNSQVALLTNMIDIGAIIGSLSLGFISDLMHARRSIVAFISIAIASTTSFCIYVYVLKMPHPLLNFLMFVLGLCVSGLDNMIATACSSDLGRQEALKGN